MKRKRIFKIVFILLGVAVISVNVALFLEAYLSGLWIRTPGEFLSDKVFPPDQTLKNFGASLELELLVDSLVCFVLIGSMLVAANKLGGKVLRSKP